MPVPKHIDIDAIRRELDRRARKAVPLQRRLATLRSKAAILERQIEALGGTVNGTRRANRSRPRNEQGLLESLTELLKGKQMQVKDIVPAVQRAGYKTSSPNFRSIVQQALVKNREFKRVARGVYTVR